MPRGNISPAPHAFRRNSERRLQNSLMPEIPTASGIESALEIDVAATNLLPSAELESLFWKAGDLGRDDLQQRLASFAGITDVVLLRDARRRTIRFAFSRFPAPCTTPRSNSCPRLGSWIPTLPRFAAFVQQPFAPAPGRCCASTSMATTSTSTLNPAGSAALIMSITRHKYWSATIDGTPHRSTPPTSRSRV